MFELYTGISNKIAVMLFSVDNDITIIFLSEKVNPALLPKSGVFIYLLPK
jgi:hypothetical protein